MNLTLCVKYSLLIVDHMKPNSINGPKILLYVLLLSTSYYAEKYGRNKINEYKKICHLIRQYNELELDSRQREILGREILITAERLGERNMPRGVDNTMNFIFINYPTLSVK